MNGESGVPIFGNKIAGQNYIERPGAYAIIQDDHGRFATLRIGTALFLPGGGSLPGETPQATLQREVMEECGREIQIGREIGEAIEYLYAPKHGVYYHIQSTFFHAMFMDGEVLQHEEKHIFAWLSAIEAMQHFQRPSQAWAVQQFINNTD
jgi:8-oxo-dGTP diphosphatase